jgi:HEAT repeat protein
MGQPLSEAFDMQKMLADYMENGLLDNIIDMFKYDKTLYGHIPGLMTDERLRVRIGTIALLEALANEDAVNRGEAIRYIIPLLQNDNQLIRGDAAYILGMIGDMETIPSLEAILNSDDPNVRTITQEAIQDIRSRS